MLKKVVIFLFVSMISVVSVTSSAAVNEPAKIAKSALSIASNNTDKDISIQVGGIDRAEVKSAISQSENKGEPILPTAWLLVIALFGFVMLSNRSGV